MIVPSTEKTLMRILWSYVGDFVELTSLGNPCHVRRQKELFIYTAVVLLSATDYSKCHLHLSSIIWEESSSCWFHKLARFHRHTSTVIYYASICPPLVSTAKVAVIGICVANKILPWQMMSLRTLQMGAFNDLESETFPHCLVSVILCVNR